MTAREDEPLRIDPVATKTITCEKCRGYGRVRPADESRIDRDHARKKHPK